ncbi:hypothetical protein HanRHA438_Chr13g0629871 [Helianthus annuus]|nr:hypothetical protein HanRHA438_Chr13g0629871 [Helianthus annuus]
MTGVTLRYAKTRFHNSRYLVRRDLQWLALQKKSHVFASPLFHEWQIRNVRHSMVISSSNRSSRELPGKVLKFLLLKFRLLAYNE